MTSTHNVSHISLYPQHFSILTSVTISQSPFIIFTRLACSDPLLPPWVYKCTLTAEHVSNCCLQPFPNRLIFLAINLNRNLISQSATANTERVTSYRISYCTARRLSLAADKQFFTDILFLRNPIGSSQFTRTYTEPFHRN